MSTWYKVTRYSDIPEPVEVVRETPSFVTYLSKSFISDTILEDRAAKVTEFHRFFPTHKEALDYLIKRTTKKFNDAVEACHKAEKTLHNLQELRKQETD